MKRILTAVILLLSLAVFSGCTDAEHSKNLLQSQGYKNVEITGYKFFGCSKDDERHTGFVATAPDGQQVKGVVCSGLFFKGSTIRFN